MKVRRFDRRTFVKNVVVNNAANGRTRLEIRVVPSDTRTPNANERLKDADAQAQAQTASTPQQQ
ncbi:MAG TPA: hypothetical protein VD867_17915 [Burkholderiales bacterium]|nr:hypothetical protein [Burkholderiales bacterium]